ncbi:hypothetical protein KY290_036874 [Solanum tuberosum]|uniref:Uncharacterized protein n=1 Tax=Solanum tuberosum TaxID=4113 RepID=A0ABQ7TVS6_SOLTU|nr:hypothetical protein KY289_036344 [Solanum tuberosum]KAH0639610.1 hypothetical protein KY285_036196 [Solanum tuberosum]KAH0738169.1 hypothetical protein KY290_036874 [Solanum tuberosum]
MATSVTSQSAFKTNQSSLSNTDRLFPPLTHPNDASSSNPSLPCVPKEPNGNTDRVTVDPIPMKKIDIHYWSS